MKTGKMYVHRSQSLVRTEGLHTMGHGLVPQGNSLGHNCHYPSAMHPSA